MTQLICPICKNKFPVKLCQTKTRKYCSIPCRNKGYKGLVRGSRGFKKPISVQFQEGIDKPAEPNECWLWKGRIGKDGYGRLSSGVLVHRFSYQGFIGHILRGLCVKQKCKYKHCVNPKHLFLEERYPTHKEAIAIRFWKKVDKTNSPYGCWIWHSSFNGKDYGIICVNNKRILAHRVAWELTHGPVPDGMCVLHNCPGGDNPSCVNPKHLWLGTQIDNVKDAARKNRFPHRFGHLSSGAKLTKDQVIQIRQFPEFVTHTTISKLFGVCLSAISRIRNGKTWPNL